MDKENVAYIDIMEECIGLYSEHLAICDIDDSDGHHAKRNQGKTNIV